MQFNKRGGRFNYTDEGAGTPVPPSESILLLEDGDFILLEDDGELMLEA